MLLKAGSKWVGTPAEGCCPPLSCLGGGGPVRGALSLASLFSLWPSAVAFLPESSASTGGVEAPSGGPPSSGALFSMSGPEPVFRFRPPPSRQLPTSDVTKGDKLLT